MPLRKIAVCVKQIPLIEDASFDPVTKTIRRDGPTVMGSFDQNAIAYAVELGKKFGAQTTSVTMGPPQAQSSLIETLAMGIDRAVHLQDRAFAGSDTMATARALALWLGRESFDLIVLGKYSLDAETGQVGPEIAELLGIAQITGIRNLSLDGDLVRAERESDEGTEEVECLLPVLLTCAERTVRPPPLRPSALEAAKGKPLTTVIAAELSSDPSQFGFAGSPTWVQDVQVQQAPSVQCKLIDAADTQGAARNVLAELDRLGALDAGRRQRRKIAVAKRKSVPGKDVWVVCEGNLEHEITRGSLELLSAGDELARKVGGALVAIGFPAAIARHAPLLAGYGADRVLIVDHPALESCRPESAAEAIALLVAERRPWGLLLCASETGRDWGPRLAARMGLGLTGDAIGLELDSEGRLVALKPAFGGNIVAPILSKTYPQMATVRSGVLELADPEPAREADLETVRPDLPAPRSRLIKATSLLDPSIVPLEGSEVVVGIGAGVGADGVERVKQFARAIGAAICATRRVTDMGWLPRQLQVGLTGKAIEPRLYFAIGIRGAPNHVIGIKRAHTVVAVNNDPEAPIFERANVGVVADWDQILPALEDTLRMRLAT
ncbi:MAG TPA: FAD-binding protein [Candidatus Binataceae bacterium]|jgi:electron transfer flavoprotein alpha subunit|nr:FAD-binding protein [Candidatus Binataceae bacterium]